MSKDKSENILLRIEHIPNSPVKNSDHQDFDNKTTENTEKGTFLTFLTLLNW